MTSQTAAPIARRPLLEAQARRAVYQAIGRGITLAAALRECEAIDRLAARNERADRADARRAAQAA